MFSVPTATAEVNFEVASGTPEIALIANPTHIRHANTGTLVRDIVLRLLDGSGAPIAGAQIIGTCAASGDTSGESSRTSALTRTSLPTVSPDAGPAGR